MDYKEIQLTDEGRRLQDEFNAICTEQESLYHKEFEAVFAKLFAIDKDLNKNFACTANEGDRAAALQAAGYGDNEALCRDFHKYNELFIRGKEVQAELLTELAKGAGPVEDNTQSGPGRWRFFRLSFIVPKEFAPAIDRVFDEDFQSNKGLFSNKTEIPLENEGKDELLMIEPYRIKGSLTAFDKELIQYGIVGDGSLFPGEVELLLLRLLKDTVKFYQKHTDRPVRVKNRITRYVSLFDDLPGYGIMLQILFLQGLLTWFEGVNLNKGDEGYDEAENVADFVSRALLDKEVRFVFMPLGDEDINTLQPLCDYLYNTHIGRAVQEAMFGPEPPEVTQMCQTDPENIFCLNNRLSWEKDTIKAMAVIDEAFKYEMRRYETNLIWRINNGDEETPAKIRIQTADVDMLRRRFLADARREGKPGGPVLMYLDEWEQRQNNESNNAADNTRFNGGLTPLTLPPEVACPAARQAFEKAQKAGFMEKTSTGYKWTFGKEHGGKTRLAYFLYKIPFSTKRPFPAKPLEKLFGVKGLSDANTQLKRAKWQKSNYVDPPQWIEDINNLFD